MDDQETKADIPRKTAREELFRARNNEGQRFDREHHVLETLELVIKQMDAAVTRCSHDLRYLWANQGYADWIKRPLNEIVGHPIVDVLGKEAFEHLQHHFVRVLTGHRVHYEEEVSFQGIGQRWISATYTPTLNPDGAANGWVAVVLDITERKRVEGELRRSEARLAAEAAALAKLDDLSSRLWQMSSLQEGLSEMLAAVVGLLGADKANVQLLDAERGVLNIVAQFGFEQPFLDFFREVSLADQSAFGRSLCSGCRIVVEDIETDEAYAPLRAIARASDYRAVTSTPLVRSDGSILGMLSTHFKSPHRPTEESLLRLDLYARQAAGFVQQCKAKRVLSQRYAAIVESSDDAIISKNLDAVIVTWNAGAQRLFGYTDAEAIGQPIAILIPPELRDEENKILEKLRTGERIEHFETIRVTNAGKRINVSLTISPMRDSTGKIVGFSKIARDISERKRTDEALRASEERLRLAQQAARIGTFEWNIRTGANTWTPELEAMYGLAPRGFGGTQTAFENLVHPDDRARVIELDNWALKTGQPTTGEWRVVWADGSVHWIAGRWQVFMNETGEPARMIGVNIDVTDRKLADQELRESEQRLRLATQAGRMYAYDWDVTKDVVVRSSEHVRILGLTEPMHFPQQQFVDKIHPDDRPKFLAAIAGLTPENPTGEVTYRALASDDTLVWLKSNGRGFFDAEGRLLRVIGMVADVTDQKLAENALRSSEERLRLAQRGARLGTFERDVRTGRITWSEGLESLYGLPLGSLEGKTTAFFKELIHPTDYEQVARLLENALKTGQPTEGEWRVVWADGSLHWIAGGWQVLMDASGEPWRVVGVNMDITERKRAEEALLEMNRTLEAQGSLLRSREELLSVFVKNVPAAVAMLDRDMRYLQVSDRWCAEYLSGREQVLGRSHYELFPDMPERWKEVHRRALEGETLRADEDRWDGQDGAHWARWEVRPWNAPEGTVGGILILTEDITRRKQMEEALSDMSRKLIESQEQERARIGRELHDDINQRLAMLGVELEQLQENPSEVRSRVQELRNQTTELSNDVQAMSHDLHSSKLEYLGVVAGIRSWCKEFGERQRVEIDFSSYVPSALPFDIGLSLFRVLQEALHNATKHSGVKRLEVQLREDSGEIHLIVRDSGKGFDVEVALRGKGLGLTSMRERVRLVNGTISIKSKPMGGTTIHVRVPLESEHAAKREAS